MLYSQGSTKTECDYLNGWIKKRSYTQKSHPKVVNPRDIAGERKKKKKKKKKSRYAILVQNPQIFNNITALQNNCRHEKDMKTHKFQHNIPHAVQKGIFFFFFAFPSYISGVHHFWVRFLRV